MRSRERPPGYTQEEVIPRRAGKLVEIGMVGVGVIAGLTGLTAGTGETAGEIDLCPGTPAPTAPLNGETEFQGSPPPGCNSWGEWAERFPDIKDVIDIGEVPCVKITVGSDDPSPKPCGGK